MGRTTPTPDQQPDDPYGQPGNPSDGPAPEEDQAEVGEAKGEGADSDEGADTSGDRGRP